MISYVSFADNGNIIPERARQNPELLWPRYCDRLEALGKGGVIRCWQYNREKREPFFVDSTPRPSSITDLWEKVTEARYNEYMRKKTSASMLDHYYDKLLHISDLVDI